MPNSRDAVLWEQQPSDKIEPSKMESPFQKVEKGSTVVTGNIGGTSHIPFGTMEPSVQTKVLNRNFF